jgi:hypothetical protein
MADAIANDEITERQALVWHFRSNLFPPPPMAMVDTALAAIHAVEAGDDDDIDLPEGVTFKGGTMVSPWEVVEAFHLSGFIDFDEFVTNVDLSDWEV